MKKMLILKDAASLNTELIVDTYEPSEKLFNYVLIRVEDQDCGHGAKIVLTNKDARRLAKMILKSTEKKSGKRKNG